VRQDPLQGRGQEDIALALAWVLATAPDEQLRDGGAAALAEVESRCALYARKEPFVAIPEAGPQPSAAA
jgi:hypothetical protein